MIATGPYKGWVFAWNAAALFFHGKDSINFTDLSSYQRNGKVTFKLLGSQPIQGGAENRVGFYTKPLGEIDLRAARSVKKFHWRWTQGDRDYTADINVTPVMNDGEKPPSAFPGNTRRGLVALEATLAPDDVRDLVAASTSYFRSLSIFRVCRGSFVVSYFSPCAWRSGDPGPWDSRTFEVKHAQKQLAVCETVTSVFPWRFVVEGKDGKHLADVGADAVDLVGLHEGDEVTFKGRHKPSEIKVTEFAKGRGDTILIECKNKHERKNGHDGRHACRDPRAAIAAVKLESFEVLGEPLEKPKHFEILGRAAKGKFIEFHVEPDGAIGKRKPADTRVPKWASEFGEK